MVTEELAAGVFYIGARDWDRRLFDELIPLPDGTSYNAYIIKGSEKIALIDSVDPKKVLALLETLKDLGITKIDYVISNHAEQDHSGAIPTVLKEFPDAKLVTNEKNKTMLMEHLLIPEHWFITIGEGDTLSLGDKTLEFILTPWVHWPETMVTYLQEDKILFSCDFFGSHFATSDTFVVDKEKTLEMAKRYYAEIMMPFRTIIKKHLVKLETYPIDMIAPSHGPIFDNPSIIVDAYKEWTADETKNEVLVPYISMHGSTAKMVEYFTNALIEKGVTVKPFNLTDVDLGEIAINLVDSATVVIATPAVLIGPHPQAVYVSYLANALRPKTRYVSVIGSFGWGCKVTENITQMVSNIKAEIIEPVMIRGYPTDDDKKQLEALADIIALKHSEDDMVN